MPEVSGYGNITSDLYQKTVGGRNSVPEEVNARTAQTFINRGVEVVLSSEQSRLEGEQYLELNKPQISDRSSELSASELRAIEDLEFERRNPPVDEPDPNEMGEAERRALEALL